MTELHTEPGLEPEIDPVDAPPRAPVPNPEVPAVRLAATGFFVTLALVLVWQLGIRLLDHASDVPPTEDLVVPVAQKVSVRAIEPTRITLTTDGKTVHKDILQAGQTLEVESIERVELEVANLTTVIVRHNGERLEPLGNLSRSRRLIFIQDRAE